MQACPNLLAALWLGGVQMQHGFEWDMAVIDSGEGDCSMPAVLFDCRQLQTDGGAVPGRQLLQWRQSPRLCQAVSVQQVHSDSLTM